MKIVVTIPAYNEEKTIASVIKEIPRDAAESVEVLVVDDGSTDNTVIESEKAGADKIVKFKKNRGLATAFRVCLDTALEMDADIIVNIDADGQYDGKEIPELIKPIVEKKADIVLGSRFKGWIEEMSASKKMGNKIATKVTSFLSHYPISDAQTGFRAFSREAALRLNVMSDYTYVQETIIQAVNKGLFIAEVPARFRKRAGKSRLIPSIFSYAHKAGITIIKTYVNYRPLRTFLYLGGFVLLVGLIAGLRVLLHYLRTGQVIPYFPTTILTVVLIIVGFQIIMLGLVADLIGTNRKMEEEILYRMKKYEK